MTELEDILREKTILEMLKKFELLKNINNTRILNTIDIEHEKENDFDGILKDFEKKYGKNLLEQGIISISASPTITNKPELRVNPSKKKKKS